MCVQGLGYMLGCPTEIVLQKPSINVSVYRPIEGTLSPGTQLTLLPSRSHHSSLLFLFSFITFTYLFFIRGAHPCCFMDVEVRSRLSLHRWVQCQAWKQVRASCWPHWAFSLACLFCEPGSHSCVLSVFLGLRGSPESVSGTQYTHTTTPSLLFRKSRGWQLNKAT